MSPSKILAVDDEPDFKSLITQRFRRQIREQEFAFQFAHNGEEALSLLAGDANIELMLLDINMPVMDGLTLLVALARSTIGSQGDHRVGVWRHDEPADRDEPRCLRLCHQAGRF